MSLTTRPSRPPTAAAELRALRDMLMSCTACDQFDTSIVISSPGQFRRIAGKVRDAVASGVLRYNTFESDRELIGQPSFVELDLSAGQIPDVMRYYFECPHCRESYTLFIEAYHGGGGTWSRSSEAD